MLGIGSLRKPARAGHLHKVTRDWLIQKGDPARPTRHALVRRVRPEGRSGQVRLLWALVGGGG
jgi:hypothetical protein